MRRAAIAVAFCLMLGGCGTTSGTYRSGVFSNEDTRFEIGELGDKWRRISAERRPDVTWYDENRAAIIQINASCDPALDIPLSSLTNHLLIGFTEREVIDESLNELDGRESLRTRVTAKLDGVQRELLLQVVKKDGCVYDFALAAARGAPFESALVDFDAMLSEFRTQPANR